MLLISILAECGGGSMGGGVRRSQGFHLSFLTTKALNPQKTPGCRQLTLSGYPTVCGGTGDRPAGWDRRPRNSPCKPDISQTPVQHDPMDPQYNRTVKMRLWVQANSDPIPNIQKHLVRLPTHDNHVSKWPGPLWERAKGIIHYPLALEQGILPSRTNPTRFQV